MQFQKRKRKGKGKITVYGYNYKVYGVYEAVYPCKHAGKPEANNNDSIGSRSTCAGNKTAFALQIFLALGCLTKQQAEHFSTIKLFQLSIRTTSLTPP
jgi:hypothetical protein